MAIALRKPQGNSLSWYPVVLIISSTVIVLTSFFPLARELKLAFYPLIGQRCINGTSGLVILTWMHRTKLARERIIDLLISTSGKKVFELDENTLTSGCDVYRHSCEVIALDAKWQVKGIRRINCTAALRSLWLLIVTRVDRYRCIFGLTRAAVYAP